MPGDHGQFEDDDLLCRARVGGVIVEQFRCLDCGAWLSLGPANDEPAKVQVEIRAAELAAEWKPVGGIVPCSTSTERVGWLLWPHEAPRTIDESAGWLASQIQNHRMDGQNVAGAEHAARVIATHDATHEHEGES